MFKLKQNPPFPLDSPSVEARESLDQASLFADADSKNPVRHLIRQLSQTFHPKNTIEPSPIKRPSRRLNYALHFMFASLLVGIALKIMIPEILISQI